ncbi:hypothetical protein [Caminibacter pacificus]|uniref:Uncharacterized protein n=1 Tax=Caminibacter pacificus TaxID=1424653 RepID=A0AAJ4RB31_9BACT|nr:hypothetical protein [Caminibacter pacificus]QDD68175.1 hypothetical protein C6V80_09990 [Caminibacter pacificus]ROR38688.1 hypothetical protein EDC58_1903 [Caminibacter pacificus]
MNKDKLLEIIRNCEEIPENINELGISFDDTDERAYEIFIANDEILSSVIDGETFESLFADAVHNSLDEVITLLEEKFGSYFYYTKEVNKEIFKALRDAPLIKIYSDNIFNEEEINKMLSKEYVTFDNEEYLKDYLFEYPFYNLFNRKLSYILEDAINAARVEPLELAIEDEDTNELLAIDFRKFFQKLYDGWSDFVYKKYGYLLEYENQAELNLKNVPGIIIDVLKKYRDLNVLFFDIDKESIEVKDTDYIRSDKTIEYLSNGMVVYNQEGLYFKVFKDKKSFENWRETGEEKYILSEFNDEKELDEYLGMFSLIKISSMDGLSPEPNIFILNPKDLLTRLQKYNNGARIEYLNEFLYELQKYKLPEYFNYKPDIILAYEDGNIKVKNNSFLTTELFYLTNLYKEYKNGKINKKFLEETIRSLNDKEVENFIFPKIKIKHENQNSNNLTNNM